MSLILAYRDIRLRKPDPETPVIQRTTKATVLTTASKAGSVTHVPAISTARRPADR